MDELDANSPTDGPTVTAEQAAWIEGHRIHSVAFRLEDLTGLVRAKRAITALAYGLLHGDEVRAAGGSVPRAVLLTGPVGCGKSSLARGLAGLLLADSASADNGAVFVEVPASELTPSRVAALARFAARGSLPVVVFIDELSWLGTDRSSRRHDAESRAALYSLLAAISGVRDPGRAPLVWLAATSDDVDSLDPALTRAGRFGHVIEVRQPDAATRRAHLERLFAARRGGSLIALEPIVEMTTGMSFSDLDQVADDSLALSLAFGGSAPLGGPDTVISQAHVREAVLARGREAEADRSPSDLWRAAAHESGHALVGAIAHGASAIRSVSIAQRGSGHEGGRTTICEAADEGASRAIADSELRARVAVSLAGGLAEVILLGESSTGSADDAQHAGQLVLQRLDAAMDPSWPAAWPSWCDMGPAAADRHAAVAWATIDACRATAVTILEAHRCGLERLARRILDEGDLAGAALQDALAEALVADAMPIAP
jgi:cell division protease FtsH